MIFFGTADQFMSVWTYRMLRLASRQDFAISSYGKLFAVQAVIPFYISETRSPVETLVILVTREVLGYDKDEIKAGKHFRFGDPRVFQVPAAFDLAWMENLDFKTPGLLFTKSGDRADRFPCTNPLCEKKEHKSLTKALMCGGTFRFSDQVRQNVVDPENWNLKHVDIVADGRLWQESWHNGRDLENEFSCIKCRKKFGHGAYAQAVACYESHPKEDSNDRSPMED